MHVNSLLTLVATTAAGLLAPALPVPAQPAKTPAVGELAPRFEGRDQEGRLWRLSDWEGRKIVLLYFYPKDDTPGCTKQACGWRDRMADLQAADVQVLGVSFDSAESHRQFIAKHNLNFPLLADTDGKIADAYGARIAGREMARRVSFLIGKDGKIAHVTDSPSADTHLAEMTAAVRKLKEK